MKRVIKMKNINTELVEKLLDKSSLKRKQAAKSFRKINDNDKIYQVSLKEALLKEIQNIKTWEIQYNMIMAIKDNHYIELLNDLKDISLNNKDLAPMVKIALGDVISDFEYSNLSNLEHVLKWIEDKEINLLEGASRFLAMKHIIPSRKIMDSLIQYVIKENDESQYFWVLAASSGWPNDVKISLLNKCQNIKRDDIQEALALSVKNEYGRWKPL